MELLDEADHENMDEDAVPDPPSAGHPEPMAEALSLPPPPPPAVEAEAPPRPPPPLPRPPRCILCLPGFLCRFGKMPLLQKILFLLTQQIRSIVNALPLKLASGQVTRIPIACCVVD